MAAQAPRTQARVSGPRRPRGGVREACKVRRVQAGPEGRRAAAELSAGGRQQRKCRLADLSPPKCWGPEREGGPGRPRGLGARGVGGLRARGGGGGGCVALGCVWGGTGGRGPLGPAPSAPSALLLLDAEERAPMEAARLPGSPPSPGRAGSLGALGPRAAGGAVRGRAGSRGARALRRGVFRSLQRLPGLLLLL